MANPLFIEIPDNIDDMQTPSTQVWRGLNIKTISTH